MNESVFDKARASVNRGFVEARFHASGAHWKGNNYFTINPMRTDGTVGSFNIREDGTWYEFLDGSHGDIFDLLAAVEGRAAVEIAQEMAGGWTPAPQSPLPPPSPRQATLPEADWKPIPQGKMPTFRGEPSCVTTYPCPATDEDMFIVVRYDHPEGKKEIFPVFWDGEMFKKGLPPSLKGENAYRPLFRFHKDNTVVIVEGEKKCSQANVALAGRYSVTCWHGGAGAADKVYVEGLIGCDVILWPDNDQAGQDAMRVLAGKLQGKAHVRIVEIPNGVPKAWDIGDCIAEGRSPEILLESSIDYPYEPGSTIDPVPVDLPTREYTDLGNSERFIDRHGGRLKYSIEKRSWLVWNGKRYTDADPSDITPMIKETVRSVAQPGDTESMGWSKKSESSGAINAMLTLASREPGIPVHEEDLDPDPYLFNCGNGIIDLRTGVLSPHRRDALCSKMSPVDYDPNAGCHRFMDFLDDISLGRGDIMNFIQRWFGYSMTGDVSAQSFAIFYGSGANGKSTLVELVARIMGDYGKSAPPDVFVQKNMGGGIPNDVAALRGARMVLTTETESNARLAESKIKALTGGDKVSARYMRGEYFEFSPSWKIIISTNHRPRVSGSDYGIWRRIVLVPFDFVATGEKVNPNLPKLLWEERSGILAWLVAGAKAWYAEGQGRDGLAVGPVLLEETQEYREDEDVIGRFLSEACWKRGEGPFDLSKFCIGASELRDAFASWCEREGEQYSGRMTQTAFGRALRERGYDKRRVSGGRFGYIGIVPKTYHGERGNDADE